MGISTIPVVSSGGSGSTPQTSKLFFAGPVTGAAAVPTFRSIATTDLATGTASASNFLRGDGTWSAPAAGGNSMTRGTWATHIGASGVTAGDMYQITDAPYLAVWTGSAWTYYYKGYLCTPPALKTWAWKNQGASTITSNGTEFLFAAPTLWRGRETAVTAPFVVTMQYTGVSREPGTNQAGTGVYITNSSGDTAVFGYTPVQGLALTKYNNAGTYLSQSVNFNMPTANQASFQGYRIADNGTNIIADVSLDGFNWWNVYTGTRAVTFASGGAATQAGFGGYHNDGNWWNRVSVFDFTVT